jgi:hypothetical protein
LWVPSGVLSEMTVIRLADADGAERAATGRRTGAQRERPFRSLRTVRSPGADPALGASVATAAAIRTVPTRRALFISGLVLLWISPVLLRIGHGAAAAAP